MKYGLIGEKLGHSYSKVIHEMLTSYQYDIIPLSKTEFPVFMEQRDFTAINVTIPYKQAVIPYLDVIDEHAKSIGAVNTIVNRDGKLYGYNTDYDGFAYTLDYFQIEVKNRNCFCLGNGGAAKAVIHALEDHGGHVTLVSRTKSENTITYEELRSLHEKVEVIVNTTPVGMYPNMNASPLDLSPFPSLEAVVDVIYNPVETMLTVQAAALGAKHATGLLMLVVQAARAIKHFIGQDVSKEEILRVYHVLEEDLRNK